MRHVLSHKKAQEAQIPGVAGPEHGALIEKYRYASLECVRDMLGVSQEPRENLCIAAHLAHVAYAGRLDEHGKVVPRYKITRATGLDEETCRR